MVRIQTMNQKELDLYVRDFYETVVNQQLSLYYQPLFDLRTGKIIGAEALVRWNHQQKGMLSPEWVFFLAEKNNVILSVEEWIIRTACRQNKAWQDAGLPPLVMTVNVSSQACESVELVGMIQAILDETKLPAHYLELEIREDATSDVERLLEIMDELRQIGVQISLDDYGKGYSCIQHLSRFPMNKLKIDYSCVKECMSDVTQAKVIKTLIAMARSLGVQVAAEGVETQEQLNFLWQLGCDSVQGFWLCEPMPAEELERVLKREERFRNSAFLLLNEAFDTYEVDQTELSQFRMIAENLSDIIVVIDRHGMITYISPSIQSVLDIAPDHVVNRHLLAVLPLETGRLVMQTIRQITVEKLPRTITFSCPDQNGKKITLEAKGTPVIHDEHETNQVIFIIRNHTKQVQTEEFLQKIDKLSVIGQMAAGVAHEIRNPVTSIKGFVQLLRRDQWKREYFDIMLAEFHQLESVLKEYVFLSRNSSEPYERINVADLLRQVACEIQETLDRHYLKLDIKEVEGTMIWCDQNQILQLVNNLLTNAVESMQDGGEIHLIAKLKGSEQVMIKIVDEGCGMVEARLKRLGEPFYSTKEKGTGLGLMVCYKIVQAHNGYIHFSSTPNKGTTVKVYFPLGNTN